VSAEDPLVAQAFDATKHDQLAEAIEKLSPDEALFFLHKLECALRKRRLQVAGYLAAMFVWAVGMVVAFGGYALIDGGIGYALFFLPFLGVGAVLYGFGRWANAVGSSPVPPLPAARARIAAPAAAAVDSEP
jgi:hypothetical protein